MKGFGDSKPRKTSVRIEDLVPVLPWPEDDFEQIRLVGPVYAYANIWFTIATQRKPDGVSIPKLCLDLDGETDEFVTEVCPYRASGKGRLQKWYAVNCIVRSLQEDEKGRSRSFPKVGDIKRRHGHKAYWATKADAKKTPVRVLIVSENAAESLVNLKKLNKVKKADGTHTYEVSDAKYGCDISIMKDKNKTGAAQIAIQKGDRTPLTNEELRYALFPLDLLKPERLEEAKREMSDLSDKIINNKKDKNKDDKKSAKHRPRDEDEDDVAELDEDDLDEDLDEDEMEDRPRKGKGNKKKSSRDEDEDEDDLDADLDEDKDEEDDEDEDDEDDEDDRRSRKKSSKSRRRDEDDEDEDEDDEDEDDEDEDDEEDDRRSRKSRKSRRR